MASITDSGGPSTFLALVIVFIILSGLLVALRFISKRMRKAPITLDDWLILAALIFYYMQLGVHLWGLISGGLAQHIQNVSQSTIVILFKQLTVLQFPYPFVLAFTRISICVLLLRIFIQRWFRIAIYIIIFLTCAWWAFLIIDGFAICRPFAANWNPMLPGAVCGDKDASYVANAAWGIILDGLIWLLPHPLVWKLQMPIAQKIALSGVFMLGILDIAVAIVRIVALLSLDVNGDVTFTLAAVEIWSLVECGVAIIIACIPVCRPIFQLILPHNATRWIRSKTGRSTNKTASGKHEDDQIVLVDRKGAGGTTLSHAVGPMGHSKASEGWDGEGIAVTSDITVTHSSAHRGSDFDIGEAV